MNTASERKISIISTLLILCTLLGIFNGETAAQQPPPETINNSNGVEGCDPIGLNGIISIVDSNWSKSSSTSDCAQGWALDEWRLTLSQPKTVRIKVDDCCCPGDYYGIYINGSLIGTTPKPAVWGCNSTGTLSSGQFDVYLPAGTHTIKVRDVSFSDHTAQEIAYQMMCPAGFTIYGTLLAPPSAPDVSLDTSSWEFNNSVSPFLPEKLWVSVTAKNIGTATANNVSVRFYLGNPDQGGTQIGADQALGTIAANGQAKATVEWTLSGNIENKTVYARVFTNSDSNTTNNTAYKPVSIWYIPFQHNEDAYSFTNWSLDWQDVANDLLMFMDYNHPDDQMSSILFPVVYPIWSMLLESGGHCYGMSATSSLYYQYPEIKPVAKTTYAMSIDEARTDIQYYHRTQTSHMMEAMMMRTFGSNVETQYNAVRTSIRDSHQPIMLLMQDTVEPYSGGHAVVAYKILDLGDEKRIYLYDNNIPLNNMNRSIYATVNMRSKTFTYNLGQYNFDRFLAAPALMTWPDTAEVIEERFYRWVLSQIINSGLIRVSVLPNLQTLFAVEENGVTPKAIIGDSVEPLVTDQYGRSIGYDNGVFVNEIPGAALSTVGEQAIFDIPSDLQYSVTVTGISSGNIALSYLIPENETLVRDVEYIDVPVAAGSIASTILTKGNADWTLTNTGQPAQQPDSIIDSQFHKTLLPNINNGASSCSGEAVMNPGFELGPAVAWSRSSTTGRSLIYSGGFPTPVTPHSGSWAAWLGNSNYEVTSLSQTIVLPAGTQSATLNYWYWIDSLETSCAYDHAWVEINGGLLYLHPICSGSNTLGWKKVTVDLTPYIGGPINLRFYMDTDSIVTSDFFIDDVSISVQCNK